MLVIKIKAAGLIIVGLFIRSPRKLYTLHPPPLPMLFYYDFGSCLPKFLPTVTNIGEGRVQNEKSITFCPELSDFLKNKWKGIRYIEHFTILKVSQRMLWANLKWIKFIFGPPWTKTWFFRSNWNLEALKIGLFASEIIKMCIGGYKLSYEITLETIEK